MLAILILNQGADGKVSAYAYGNTKESVARIYNSFMGDTKHYQYVGGYLETKTLNHIVRAYECLKEEAGE